MHGDEEDYLANHVRADASTLDFGQILEEMLQYEILSMNAK
jgi:hypothetical protein